MLPLYKIFIDLEDETLGFDFNSIVDVPAHLRAFEAYGQSRKVEYFAEDEKMRVTGVAIAANMPIYRKDNQLGEHHVIFFPDEIEKMWIRNNEKGWLNNVNRQHDMDGVVDRKNMFIIEQWIVNREQNLGVPKALEKQNIADGSLMYTYQIRDRGIWNKVKDGTFNGFSVEGLFLKSPIRVNKSGFAKTLSAKDLIVRDLFYATQKKQNK